MELVYLIGYRNNAYLPQSCDWLSKDGYSSVCWQGMKGLGLGGGNTECPSEIRTRSLWGIAAYNRNRLSGRQSEASS